MSSLSRPPRQPINDQAVTKASRGHSEAPGGAPVPGPAGHCPRRLRSADADRAARRETGRDAGPPPAPLPDQLASLAAQYQAAGDTAINLTVTGLPRPLSEQVTNVAYRTAQEGLTNARKHAPGQPVTLGLGFEPGEVTVSVANPLPPVGYPGPLAETGAGAGLTGLKERAALSGGTLEAGPAAGTWRIDLTIPA
jgi:signal transduction histidine kinase